MQSRANDIKALRNILSVAKSIFCINFKADPFHSNRDIYGDALSAFSMIGKEKIYELAPDVYQFLNCNDKVFRETAVTTLGLSTRLHLPEFKDIAYKIWVEDKDGIVRNAALRAWTSYYSNSQDKEVLKTLYKILLNENYSIADRRVAMQDIFYVSGETPKFYDPFQDKHLYLLRSHEEFNQKIDWDEIRAVMVKHAPNALI